MMLDTHCHIDQFPDPMAVAMESEEKGITTVAVTNLPSHYAAGTPHLQNFKYVKLALGLHPLAVGDQASELADFLRLVSGVSHVGEIGLDFSREGLRTKDSQIIAFRQIAASLRGTKKIVSLHSRQAEETVLTILLEEQISEAIFHWYSGPLTVLDRAVDKGFYFSVNPAMVRSRNGQKIIARVPRKQLLTETDGPYVKIGTRPAQPRDVKDVLDYLAQNWNVAVEDAAHQIASNFENLLSRE